MKAVQVRCSQGRCLHVSAPASSLCEHIRVRGSSKYHPSSKQQVGITYFQLVSLESKLLTNKHPEQGVAHNASHVAATDVRQRWMQASTSSGPISIDQRPTC